jgi:hypothetical protein
MTLNLANVAFLYVFICGGLLYLICWCCIVNVCLHSCFTFEKRSRNTAKVAAYEGRKAAAEAKEQEYYNHESSSLLDVVGPLKTESRVSEMLGSFSTRKKSKYSN